MLVKSQAMVACLLLICAFWSSTTSMAHAQSEELQRPTRPDTFTSADQVAQYVKDMHEYLRRKSIRYGKRFAPMPQSEEANMNVMDAGDDGVDEENPQEEFAQQMLPPPLPPKEVSMYRLLNDIPLPLLAKYLRVNQMIDQHDGNRRSALLQPFVRQRVLATKQNPNNF